MTLMWNPIGLHYDVLIGPVKDLEHPYSAQIPLILSHLLDHTG